MLAGESAVVNGAAGDCHDYLISMIREARTPVIKPEVWQDCIADMLSSTDFSL
jgi:hypothetical protein